MRADGTRSGTRGGLRKGRREGRAEGRRRSRRREARQEREATEEAGGGAHHGKRARAANSSGAEKQTTEETVFFGVESCHVLEHGRKRKIFGCARIGRMGQRNKRVRSDCMLSVDVERLACLPACLLQQACLLACFEAVLRATVGFLMAG